MAGTPGAEYHPALDTESVDVHIRKGQGVPAYSIFEGTDDAGQSVSEVLTSHGITDVDMVGIATDYCVRASTLAAASACPGLPTIAPGRRIRMPFFLNPPGPQAKAFIGARPKPLALYVFSGSSETADHVLASTSSGGACVNQTILHINTPNLPFGGVGPSGW